MPSEFMSVKPVALPVQSAVATVLNRWISPTHLRFNFHQALRSGALSGSPAGHIGRPSSYTPPVGPWGGRCTPQSTLAAPC